MAIGQLAPPSADRETNSRRKRNKPWRHAKPPARGILSSGGKSSTSPTRLPAVQAEATVSDLHVEVGQRVGLQDHISHVPQSTPLLVPARLPSPPTQGGEARRVLSTKSCGPRNGQRVSLGERGGGDGAQRGSATSMASGFMPPPPKTTNWFPHLRLLGPVLGTMKLCFMVPRPQPNNTSDLNQKHATAKHGELSTTQGISSQAVRSHVPEKSASRPPRIEHAVHCVWI